MSSFIYYLTLRGRIFSVLTLQAYETRKRTVKEHGLIISGHIQQYKLRFVWMHINDFWNWIEWEFQIRSGKEMTYNLNSVVGWLEIRCWNHRVVFISNSCLDVQIIVLDVFFEFDNIMLCTHIHSRICILKPICIIFHT
jgi:hypothetical protein